MGYRRCLTYLAGSCAGATFPHEMGTAVQANATARPNLWQRRVVRTSAKDAKTAGLFAVGSSILISNFLASFIRAGDELLFSLSPEVAGANPEIFVRHNPEERRQDIFQAQIGYVSQPRKDKRDNLFVSA